MQLQKKNSLKAKSILLKTNTEKKSLEKKKVKKLKKKKQLENKVKKEKTVKTQKIVKEDINEDLTESYIHISEIEELGTFELISKAPDGMFKSKNKSFPQRAKNATQDMYLIFVQQKNLMEKYPENLMKAMGYFEFFYMEQLRKKKKNIAAFKKKWPDIPHYIKKDIKSLYFIKSSKKNYEKIHGSYFGRRCTGCAE